MEKTLELSLNRIYKSPTYTIGKLFIDDLFFCDTLEDAVREIGSNGKGKIKGETAIPAGRYKVILTMSQRFKRVMPLLVDVQHFDGIRIHSGNTEFDTEGCILVGVNSEKGKVLMSKITEEALMKRLSAHKGDIYITIS